MFTCFRDRTVASATGVCQVPAIGRLSAPLRTGPPQHSSLPLKVPRIMLVNPFIDSYVGGVMVAEPRRDLTLILGEWPAPHFLVQ